MQRHVLLNKWKVMKDVYNCSVSRSNKIHADNSHPIRKDYGCLTPMLPDWAIDFQPKALQNLSTARKTCTKHSLPKEWD